MGPVTVIPVPGFPEVRPGDVLSDLVAERADLADGDVVVVTQKVVSKAEGRLVPVKPDDRPSVQAVVEAEAVRVLRRRGDLLMTETRHGFVCANAGVDLSNVERGWAALLPLDPDRSARRLRDGLGARRDRRGHRLRRRGRGDRPQGHRGRLGTPARGYGGVRGRRDRRCCGAGDGQGPGGAGGDRERSRGIMAPGGFGARGDRAPSCRGPVPVGHGPGSCPGTASPALRSARPPTGPTGLPAAAPPGWPSGQDPAQPGHGNEVEHHDWRRLVEAAARLAGAGRGGMARRPAPWDGGPWSKTW